MTATAAPHLLTPLTRLAPGLALAGTLAALATLLAQLAGMAGIVASPLVLALLLGLVIAQFGTLPSLVRPGLAFACRPLLRFAIVLLGLRIGLPQIAEIGVRGIASVAVLVTGTLASGYWISRRLGLSKNLAWLLASGHAICGAAAIMATDSVLKAKEREVSQALTLVTLFGTVTMLVCPLLGKAFGLDAATYGFWVGGSIHEVAQAVAAGFALGEATGEAASLVKMVRVAFLLPLGLFLATAVVRRGTGQSTDTGRRIVVPWFVAAFAAVAVIDACGFVPAPLANVLRTACTIAMTVAMAALGLQSSLRDLASGGLRPLVAAGFTTIVISVLAFALAPHGPA
jgi:uncharacterized integral membrane protein (TIGR00698 family)